MAYGVFIHRQDSRYRDTPAERYHFPAQYLGRVRACLGDWVIYYEPRKIVGTRGYFAVARVQQIIPDPENSGMFFAVIQPSSYLNFARDVPFADDQGVTERGLLNLQGRISGRAQSAVRPLSRVDFDRIIGLGLDETTLVLSRTEQGGASGFEEQQVPFASDQGEDRNRYLSSRMVRDRVFRRVVLNAYRERCAISGLRLINGGGRAEVAAAHIRPVEANGPDIVSNGIALSGTAHWMFDRGLISLSDDLDILISRQVNDRGDIEKFIHTSGRALAPARAQERPHPYFLRWHRENCFKL